MLNCFCFNAGQKESTTTFYRDREIHPCVKDLQRPLQGLPSHQCCKLLTQSGFQCPCTKLWLIIFLLPLFNLRWNVGPLFNLCEKKKIYLNKHTVSIAEAIHVPYRPQQISKRHNSRKNYTWKDTKVKIFLYYINTKSYPKILCQYLARRKRKVRKSKFKQKKICGMQSGEMK